MQQILSSRSVGNEDVIHDEMIEIVTQSATCPDLVLYDLRGIVSVPAEATTAAKTQHIVSKVVSMNHVLLFADV